MSVYTTLEKRPDGTLRLAVTPVGRALLERYEREGTAIVAEGLATLASGPLAPLADRAPARAAPSVPVVPVDAAFVALAAFTDLTLEHIGPRVPHLPDAVGDGGWYGIGIDTETVILAEQAGVSARRKRRLHGIWWAPGRSRAELVLALRQHGYVDLLPARLDDLQVPYALRAALAECFGLRPPLPLGDPTG